MVRHVGHVLSDSPGSTCSDPHFRSQRPDFESDRMGAG